jgi:ABC-type sugar transport system permease subunit
LEKTFFERNRVYKKLFYIIPLTAFWFVFGLLPNIHLFYVAFFNWNGVSKEKIFVGLQNFKEVINDSQISRVVMNTVLYVLFLLVIQTVFALILAYSLKKNTKKNIFFRTLFFSPLVLSTTVVGLTWGYMYDTNLGMINTLLGAAGLKNLQQDWLGVVVLSVFCVVMVHIWQNIGYPITMMLAGMTGISHTLSEAASVEGANEVQIFFHVTLPLLAPTLLRIILLTIVTGAVAFDYVFILSGGGSSTNAQPFDTVAAYMWRNLSSTYNYGKPAAISVFLSLTIFCVYIVQFFVTKRTEEKIQ